MKQETLVTLMLAWVLTALVTVRAQFYFDEIMYHPPAGIDNFNGQKVDGDDYEFIELLNAGSESIDLSGAYFSQGIRYTFPAGTLLQPAERVVIVRNVARFTERYGSVPQLLPGSYDGKLSNGGETLLLNKNDASIWITVSYGDDPPWPRCADGSGCSLQRIGTNLSDPASWSNSALWYGSPGLSGQPHQSSILINELLAHSDPPQEDAIELFNPSTNPVDLSGWYLSDSSADPFKYAISNVVIAGQSFAMVYEYQFNSQDPINSNNTAFALSSLGDQLYLTAPGRLSDEWVLVDHIDFDATPNKVSYGRSPNGAATWSLLQWVTFGSDDPSTVEEFRLGRGAINSAPQGPRLVISEIMYHPAQEMDELYEYVELFNATTGQVDLTGWSLKEQQLIFPAGTLLDPGAYLICSASQEVTRLHYGISNTVGQWQVPLSNSGGTVTLLDADRAQVDRVSYDDRHPWPAAADGYGPSLEKINLIGNSSDAANWSTPDALSEWTSYSWTQTVDSASANLKFWLNDSGRVQLDDVMVHPVGGGGASLVLNGSFADGMNHWMTDGNHGLSRVVDPGDGNLLLSVVCNKIRSINLERTNPVEIYYGSAASNHLATAALSFTPGTNYEIIFRARHSHLVPQISASIEGSEHVFDLINEGSPGTVNTCSGRTQPGLIEDVLAGDAPIYTGDTFSVVAHMSMAVSNVTCQYRFISENSYDYSSTDYTPISLRDDGLPPDTTAGDLIYTANKAAGNQPGIIRYHVLAESDDQLIRFPLWGSPTPDAAVAILSSEIDLLPQWQLFIDSPPVLYPQSRRAAAISPSGQLLLDFEVRHRGRPSSSAADRTGLALRFLKDTPYQAWFGETQDGTNLRHRGNNSQWFYNRIVNEYLAYDLQRMLGLITPHNRHVLAMINGVPTITMEVESPQDGFLKLHGSDSADYVSRAGYTGRRVVDGDPALDNLDDLLSTILSTTPEARLELIRDTIDYEQTSAALTLLSVTANADQSMNWNMFQHRNAKTGRWHQYPWDVDNAFRQDILGTPGTYLPEIHPYYQTASHPSIWSPTAINPPGEFLFHPEQGTGSAFTESFRYRHQMNLWRACQTWFTTNALFPKLDALQTKLAPVYDEIYRDELLTNQVAAVKDFIVERRNYIQSGNWSDRNTSIWSRINYDSASVVFNEILVDPAGQGEYLELLNFGADTVDMSHWLLQAGLESYRLPHGTLIHPQLPLIITDDLQGLVLAFSELQTRRAPQARQNGNPVYDRIDTWELPREPATLAVEIPALTLPNTGAELHLYDLLGRLVCSFSYTESATQAVLERTDPTTPNVGNWHQGPQNGSPGARNAAEIDRDSDGLPDDWEQLIVAAALATNIEAITAFTDSDEDGLSDREEFICGTDPVTKDFERSLLHLQFETAVPAVSIEGIELDDPFYHLYSDRLYSFEQGTADLIDWTAISSQLPGRDTSLILPLSTNHMQQSIRVRINLPGWR